MSAASSNLRLVLLVVPMILVAVGCGESEDTVDRPFIRGWDLDERQCDQQIAESRCYRLTLDVFDYPGESAASCRIYALDDSGVPYDLDAAIAPDLDPVSAEHEVAIIDGFTIRSGDVPEFSVVLPAIEDESFRRWQVSCHPGAPG